jgi:hypothetical protein
LRSAQHIWKSLWRVHLEDDPVLREKYNEPPESTVGLDFLYKKPQYQKLLDARHPFRAARHEMYEVSSTLSRRIIDKVGEPFGKFTKAAGIPQLEYSLFDGESRPGFSGSC